MSVGFFSANTTIKISSFVNTTGISTSTNDLVYTVPADVVFVGTIAVVNGTIEGGVSGGGNTVFKASGAGSQVVILGPGRTVRIGNDATRYAITGMLLVNSPS